MWTLQICESLFTKRKILSKKMVKIQLAKLKWKKMKLCTIQTEMSWSNMLARIQWMICFHLMQKHLKVRQIALLGSGLGLKQKMDSLKSKRTKKIASVANQTLILSSWKSRNSRNRQKKWSIKIGRYNLPRMLKADTCKSNLTHKTSNQLLNNLTRIKNRKRFTRETNNKDENKTNLDLQANRREGNQA